jgi:hypothetical protein
MTKVITELEGGLGQVVYSDDKQVQVAVLDLDFFEDLYPKLDPDSFFSPELDPEPAFVKRRQKKSG